MKSTARRSKEVGKLQSELIRVGLTEDYPGMDNVYQAVTAFKSDGIESELQVPITRVQRTLVMNLTNDPDTFSNILLRYDGVGSFPHVDDEKSSDDDCPNLVDA